MGGVPRPFACSADLVLEEQPHQVPGGEGVYVRTAEGDPAVGAIDGAVWEQLQS